MKSGKRMISFDRINENMNLSLFVLRIWICILNRSCHFLFIYFYLFFYFIFIFFLFNILSCIDKNNLCYKSFYTIDLYLYDL